MSVARSRLGVPLGALLLWASLAGLLSSCSLFHHHRRQDVGCRQPAFSASAENLPPLQAPPGLNGPDTSQQIRIPSLTTPPPVRPASAPCLDWPPPYVREPLTPPARRVPPPPPAQAPAAPGQ